MYSKPSAPYFWGGLDRFPAIHLEVFERKSLREVQYTHIPLLCSTFYIFVCGPGHLQASELQCVRTGSKENLTKGLGLFILAFGENSLMKSFAFLSKNSEYSLHSNSTVCNTIFI